MYDHKNLTNQDNTSSNSNSDNFTTNLTYYFDSEWGCESRVNYTKGYYETAQDFESGDAAFKLIRIISRNLSVNGMYRQMFKHWIGTGMNNDYQVYNPALGFSYSYGENDIISLNAGYFVQDIDNQDNKKGLTADGTIGKTWKFKEGFLKINGYSGYGSSELNLDNLGFNVYYGSNLSFSYQLAKTIVAFLNASYKNTDYVDHLPGVKERIDQSIISGVGLQWQIERWLDAKLVYSHNELNSNIDLNDYIDNKIILTVTAQFLGFSQIRI
jgi:hypothetical protein